jgi:hypothetical protein
MGSLLVEGGGCIDPGVDEANQSAPSHGLTSGGAKCHVELSTQLPPTNVLHDCNGEHDGEHDEHDGAMKKRKREEGGALCALFPLIVS